MENINVNGVEYTPVLKNHNNFVIVRGDRSGVFSGFIKEGSEQGQNITLLNCRRIFYWSGAASISQLAVDGVKNPSSCKFPCEVQEIRIKDIIEVIPCTEKAIKSIQAVPVWSA